MVTRRRQLNRDWLSKLQDKTLGWGEWGNRELRWRGNYIFLYLICRSSGRPKREQNRCILDEDKAAVPGKSLTVVVCIQTVQTGERIQATKHVKNTECQHKT